VVYDRHCGVAYSLAYRILGAQGPAEDACQEAFISVWRSAGRYDARLGSVRSWVLSVTHNRSLDQLRRVSRHTDRQVHDETAAERMPAAEDTEATAMERAGAEETRTLMASLSDEQRRAIELSVYSGFSHGEIAEALGVPLGTVKSRIRMGLEKLRMSMTQQPA
jgi:RNA polymerase sigma-70 factor (ECF subfamily)